MESFKTALFFLTTTLVLSLSHAQIVVSDNFETNTTSGGTGWTGDWTHGGAGDQFINGGSQIDGTYGLALFTGGSGVSTTTRSFANSIDTPGTQFTATWSLKGLANSIEIGLNLLGQKSDSSSNILTLKFTGSGDITLNDGGNDFTQTGVSYSNNTIYDFSVTAEVGSNQYSWSVNQRGGGGSASGNNFTFSNSATLTNFSSVQFFWNAPVSSGNDGVLDSVSVQIVPEPSTYALLTGLAMAGAVLCRRRRRGTVRAKF
jgi:hypothetical protein